MPPTKKPTKHVLIYAAAFSVFARLLLQSHDVFLNLMQSAQTSNGKPPLVSFVELWLDRFDSIPTLAGRKLSALALCQLLSAPDRWVLSQLTDIVTNLTSVWFEVFISFKALTETALSQLSQGGICTEIHDGTYGNKNADSFSIFQSQFGLT